MNKWFKLFDISLLRLPLVLSFGTKAKFSMISTAWKKNQRHLIRWCFHRFAQAKFAKSTQGKAQGSCSFRFEPHQWSHSQLAKASFERAYCSTARLCVQALFQTSYLGGLSKNRPWKADPETNATSWHQWVHSMHGQDELEVWQEAYQLFSAKSLC